VSSYHPAQALRCDVIVFRSKESLTREVKNEVQDSRSRNDGVHHGSGHHGECCSPQGCCRPSASRACGGGRSSFAAGDGNAATVEAGCSSSSVGPLEKRSGPANRIWCSTSGGWNWWGGCSWNWWKSRPERWTGCFVLGLASAVPSWIEARHNTGRPGQFEPPNFERSGSGIRYFGRPLAAGFLPARSGHLSFF
jgi:hypothetical protein